MTGKRRALSHLSDPRTHHTCADDSRARKWVWEARPLRDSVSCALLEEEDTDQIPADVGPHEVEDPVAFKPEGFRNGFRDATRDHLHRFQNGRIVASRFFEAIVGEGGRE